MAGHVGLELRNVVANYPFERSHRFAGIQPNLGHRDYSRAAALGDTQLVLDLSRRLARAVRHRGRIAQIAEIAEILRQRELANCATQRRCPQRNAVPKAGDVNKEPNLIYI